MKVYLVEINNCELYEDYYEWIDGVFTTYRGASIYLINKGYTPYPFKEWYDSPYMLRFERKEDEVFTLVHPKEEEYGEDMYITVEKSGARILEKELKEVK